MKQKPTTQEMQAWSQAFEAAVERPELCELAQRSATDMLVVVLDEDDFDIADEELPTQIWRKEWTNTNK